MCGPSFKCAATPEVSKALAIGNSFLGFDKSISVAFRYLRMLAVCCSGNSSPDAKHTAQTIVANAILTVPSKYVGSICCQQRRVTCIAETYEMDRGFKEFRLSLVCVSRALPPHVMQQLI